MCIFAELPPFFNFFDPSEPYVAPRLRPFIFFLSPSSLLPDSLNNLVSRNTTCFFFLPIIAFIPQQTRLPHSPKPKNRGSHHRTLTKLSRKTQKIANICRYLSTEECKQMKHLKRGLIYLASETLGYPRRERRRRGKSRQE